MTAKTANLTVVFNPNVPLTERQRLLTGLKNPFMSTDEETDAYSVEVPDSEQLTWAQKYADLMYGESPAVSRVSYSRPLRDLAQ